MKSPKSSKQFLLKYFKPVKPEKELHKESFDFDLEDNLGHLMFQRESNSLFMSRFDSDNIMELLETVNLTDHLRSQGFDNFQIRIDKDESLINYLKVYHENKDPQNLLIDLRLSETKFVPEKRFFEEGKDIETLDMVVIEWLSARHPYKEFGPQRPQLPGQEKPGLGCLNHLMELMYHVGSKVFKDGFMDVPDHFHGAVMYSKKFRFFNPSHEAILRAMLRDLNQYSLVELSWGMITETIIESNSGRPQIYDPSEQIFPLSKFMHDYFESKKYKEKFNQVYKQKKYYFDYDTMLKRKEELLQEKKPEEL